MIQIDRMALADIGNTLAIADAVLTQLGPIQPPIPIEEVALAAGITDIKIVPTAAFEGALLAPDDKIEGTILVRQSAYPERRRFTIGHELGHFLNPWHVPPAGGFQCSTQDLRDSGEGKPAGPASWEGEANDFAAALLMPKTLFRSDLRKVTEPGLEHVVRLGARYKTSALATARRFIQLHGDAMAIVVTKGGVVDQIYRHNSFPYISLQRGQSVHRQCSTTTFAGESGDCSDMNDVEPVLWLSNPLTPGRQLFEQVLVQGSGYRLTLLSIDESEAEDEDDEYVRARSEWNPTFHRR